jgi:hypothetical protein
MTESVEKFRELIHEDRCQTIHELADTVGVSCGVFQEVLKENLNVCCISASLFPDT